MKPIRKQPLAVDVHVGRRIRSRRMEIGISQEKLGEQCGITFQQIQKYEKGTNRVGASRLMQIASILKCQPSYFLHGAPGSALDTTLVPDIDPALVEFAADRKGHEIVRAWSKLPKNVRTAFHNAIVATAEAQ